MNSQKHPVGKYCSMKTSLKSYSQKRKGEKGRQQWNHSIFNLRDLFNDSKVLFHDVFMTMKRSFASICKTTFLKNNINIFSLKNAWQITHFWNGWLHFWSFLLSRIIYQIKISNSKPKTSAKVGQSPWLSPCNVVFCPNDIQTQWHSKCVSRIWDCVDLSSSLPS